MAKPSVPRAWPNSTVVCLASGPSLTREDVDYVRGKAKVIAVNTSYQLAPWADCLYSADSKWWSWYKGAPDFAGLKYTLEQQATRWPGVQCLRRTGAVGLETDPTGLKTGSNSGYQAIGLGVHLGASRIILLGYDMQRGPKGEQHWHPDHPDRARSEFPNFIRKFETLVAPLQRANVTVINCSRRTALKCFPCQSLELALSQHEVAA
jgi:hypothetical protein